MGKPKKSESNTPVENQPASPNNADYSPSAKVITYVVVRDGYRVEDREYNDPNDPAAISTKEFWTRVEKKQLGKPVEIVQYDPKKHRVW